MNNISSRAVICYLGLKGLTPKEIHEDMVVTLGEDVGCCLQGRCGRESLEDDPHLGRPLTSTTEESIAKIRDIIIGDRRVMERYIATEFGISRESIHAVINNELHLPDVAPH